MTIFIISWSIICKALSGTQRLKMLTNWTIKAILQAGIAVLQAGVTTQLFLMYLVYWSLGGCLNSQRAGQLGRCSIWHANSQSGSWELSACPPPPKKKKTIFEICCRAYVSKNCLLFYPAKFWSYPWLTSTCTSRQIYTKYFRVLWSCWFFETLNFFLFRRPRKMKRAKKYNCTKVHKLFLWPSTEAGVKYKYILNITMQN